MEDFLKRSLAFLLLIFFSPIFFIIYVLIKTTSKGEGFYQQWRTGKNKKPFKIIKFRTMVEDADKIKKKYKFLNKADGPVFKIYEDPRFTKIGKFLSHTGLDELPQLINILKGEMDFVGPRPFPIEEAEKIPQKYNVRFSVLPGITSLWVVKGAFHDNFDYWMKLDIEYIKNKNFWYDLKIIFLTLIFILKKIIKKLITKN